MATKKQKDEYAQLARLGCVLCAHFGYDTPDVEMHHVRRFGGKRDNASVLPLCTEHHRGNTGVHGLGAKGFERHHAVSFETLLESVQEKLNE